MRLLLIWITFCALLSFSSFGKTPTLSASSSSSTADDTLPVIIADEMALFNNSNGAKAFNAWCMNKVSYPTISLENGVQGKVYISFIIERDGALTNAKLVRGCNKDLDSAALGVVKRAPNLWQPARNNGQPVRQIFYMPIEFILR